MVNDLSFSIFNNGTIFFEYEENHSRIKNINFALRKN